MFITFVINTEYMDNESRMKWYLKNLLFCKEYGGVCITHQNLIDNFGEYLPKFKKIMSYDYATMLKKIVQMEEKGLSSEQAKIEAFYAIAK